jgi:hypothetical protein
MSDFGKLIVERIERHLSQKFEIPIHMDTVRRFAKVLVEHAQREWSRRPWMRPPTQTGRRK